MLVTLRTLKDYCSSFFYNADWSFSFAKELLNDKIRASVGAKQTCLPSIISNIANDVITEYSRFSSLLTVRDDSQERRLRNCQFHTDVVKSLIYKSGQERYCLRMENKRSQR